MRRFSVLALFCCVVLLFGACTPEAKEPTLDVQALSKQLLEQIDFPEMVDVSTRVQRFYAPYSNDNFAQVKAFLCAEAVLADEIAIFQVKDAAKVAEVKAGLDSHYKAREEEYSSYAPKETERIRKRLAIAKGSWLVYVISDDNATAEKLINEAFK